MKSSTFDLSIHPLPNEIENPIRFDHDEEHRAYDAEYANRFWRALVQADRVFKTFRARFIGKVSPVHFFWGAPDLAVTRFSGRRAPMHPGGIPHLPDWVTREAYSHEVSSCGFWPGGGAIAYPAFYSYAYPEPAGFAQARVKPDAAFYSTDLHEFILPYDAVRQVEIARRDAARIPADHVRSGGECWASGIARHSSAATSKSRQALREKLERCRHLPAQQCVACCPFRFGRELLEKARFAGDQQGNRHAVAIEHAVAGQRG